MPIPWLTVLSNVPWSDVISNAPKVADSAKKLWHTVARKPGAAASARSPLEGLTDTPPAQGLDPAGLASRQARLETALIELHGQMLASSELIKALAEQNTQLVASLDAQRRRLRRLGLITAAVMVAALVALGLALSAAR